jgi:hypothetical protein
MQCKSPPNFLTRRCSLYQAFHKERIRPVEVGILPTIFAATRVTLPNVMHGAGGGGLGKLGW